MSDTKEVDTLEQEEILEPQNTDTDLEEVDDGTDSDRVDSNDNDMVDINEDLLDSLNDEQFTEFLMSGKLPENTKPNTSTKDKIKEEVKIEDKKDNSVPKVKEKEVTPTNDINYKSIYDNIFKPFKANGKMITPRTAEDIVNLMQQGANYTKKMQEMAKVRKAYESLNKAEINDDELNFLIDVHKGDKEAIKKLLQKHKVDPLEIDLESTNYVPKNNLASEEEIEYSSVLEEIQSSIPKIKEILNKTWDNKSKQQLLKDPVLLRALHEEIELGRFDDVQAQLELEKTFGRYKGKSDVEIYIDLVTKLVSEQANGTKNITTNNKPTNTPKNIPDKSKAAPNKTKVGSKSSSFTSKDIFSMSEEEFAKLSINDLV